MSSLFYDIILYAIAAIVAIIFVRTASKDIEERVEALNKRIRAKNAKENANSDHSAESE